MNNTTKKYIRKVECPKCNQGRLFDTDYRGEILLNSYDNTLTAIYIKCSNCKNLISINYYKKI